MGRGKDLQKRKRRLPSDAVEKAVCASFDAVIQQIRSGASLNEACQVIAGAPSMSSFAKVIKMWPSHFAQYRQALAHRQASRETVRGPVVGVKNVWRGKILSEHEMRTIEEATTSNLSRPIKKILADIGFDYGTAVVTRGRADPVFLNKWRCIMAARQRGIDLVRAKQRLASRPTPRPLGGHMAKLQECEIYRLASKAARLIHPAYKSDVICEMVIAILGGRLNTADIARNDLKVARDFYHAQVARRPASLESDVVDGGDRITAHSEVIGW